MISAIESNNQIIRKREKTQLSNERIFAYRNSNIVNKKSCKKCKLVHF